MSIKLSILLKNILWFIIVDTQENKRATQGNNISKNFNDTIDAKDR